jgi:hypothetical protein
MFVAYTRARGALRDMSELGKQTDPLEPPGRRCGCWPMSPIFFLADYGSGRTLELGRSPPTPLVPGIIDARNVV